MIYRRTLICLLLSLYLLPACDSYAIPAFARKYNMTCRTCHSPFPSLKPYGEDFAANGFVLADQDAPRYFVNTGDEDLQLLRDLPIAIKLEAYATYNNGNKKQSDFTGPMILKLLSGGNLAKHISYYFYFILERGEVTGLEDAFIMINDLLVSGLDLYIGQFQVSDPLFKRELRLTLDDYQIYKARPGSSNVDLTYDRGVMLTYDLPTNTSLALEVINGNGIGGLQGDNFDNDKYKNFMGRITQDIIDELRIGGFGYYGKEEKTSAINELWMAGADGTISIDPLELNLQYVEREDKNPMFFLQSPEKVKTRGAFGELIFRPNGDDSRWYSSILYNWIESGQSDLNVRMGTVHLGYLVKRNIRFIGEFSYNFADKFGLFSTGFVTAF